MARAGMGAGAIQFWGNRYGLISGSLRQNRVGEDEMIK